METSNSLAGEIWRIFHINHHHHLFFFFFFSGDEICHEVYHEESATTTTTTTQCVCRFRWRQHLHVCVCLFVGYKVPHISSVGTYDRWCFTNLSQPSKTIRLSTSELSAFCSTVVASLLDGEHLYACGSECIRCSLLVAQCNGWIVQ